MFRRRDEEGDYPQLFLSAHLSRPDLCSNQITRAAASSALTYSAASIRLEFSSYRIQIEYCAVFSLRCLRGFGFSRGGKSLSIIGALLLHGFTVSEIGHQAR